MPKFVGVIERNPVQHYWLPMMFVALYGSGFVGAKYGLPYAGPLTFLVWRFAIAGFITVLLALVFKANWPKRAMDWAHIAFAGLLTVATFSAGVFVAIALGIPPALSALIIALQPMLVALLARQTLAEQIMVRQWLGLCLGLLGVVCVVAHKLVWSTSYIQGLIFAVLALVGLSVGNIYQKRFCTGMHVLSGGAIQSLASLMGLFPLAYWHESMQVIWSTPFVAALSYMSIGVSIGALSLFYVMIRSGTASQVASVFYLVPVSAAITAYLMYNEHIDLLTLLGAGLVAMGVYLVNLRKSE